jgi:hypothetical protein
LFDETRTFTSAYTIDRDVGERHCGGRRGEGEICVGLVPEQDVAFGGVASGREVDSLAVHVVVELVVADTFAVGVV